MTEKQDVQSDDADVMLAAAEKAAEALRDTPSPVFQWLEAFIRFRTIAKAAAAAPPLLRGSAEDMKCQAEESEALADSLEVALAEELALFVAMSEDEKQQALICVPGLGTIRDGKGAH